VAGTDTHNATAGKADENDFPGHVGTVDDSAGKRLGEGTATHDALTNNPGGLSVVWAEERSREAIFAALRRAETYATSGPRIELRLFGGWGYPDELCADPDWVAEAYASGVPMGGDLPAAPTSAGADGPRLVVWAKADRGTIEHPGGLLQRLQIVKGWIGAHGLPEERIVDVAGDPDNGASVDESSCEPIGRGDAQLCVVWQDPEFDPSSPAFYYARVVENPSCRWSAWDCLRLESGEQPTACTDPAQARTTQEMAWSSPIWYAPGPR
jgi:hypothetical protein